MGRLPAARRESDRLRDRDITADVLAKDERATQDPVGSCAEVEVDQRGGFGRRPADEHGPTWRGAELGDVGEFGRNDIKAPGPRIDRSQRPDAIADEARNQAIGGLERVGRHAELPLRSPEFGVHRVKRFDRSVALAIEIPPARTSVRYEIKIPVRRPFWLEHRLVRSARDSARVSDCPIRKNVPDPDLGRHPWHIGMAPGQPGHAFSVGTETRRRIEVVARNKNLGSGHAGEVDVDQRRDRLTCTAVILSDANHVIPAAVDDAIRITQRVRSDAGGTGVIGPGGKPSSWR